MAGIRNNFATRDVMGGTYLQALQPKGVEQTFSTNTDLKVQLNTDTYERGSAQIRFRNMIGGWGWANGMARADGSLASGQPYAPWEAGGTNA